MEFWDIAKAPERRPEVMVPPVSAAEGLSGSVDAGMGTTAGA